MEEIMTIEHWKALIVEGWGENVYYRETGQHGWDKLVDVNSDGVMFEHQNNGPHWIDAAPKTGWLKTCGKLIGTYNVTSQTGKIFTLKDSDKK